MLQCYFINGHLRAILGFDPTFRFIMWLLSESFMIKQPENFTILNHSKLDFRNSLIFYIFSSLKYFIFDLIDCSFSFL